MPVLGALADVTTIPIEGLAITAALGASLAFMLPVGTPPNAMVFATGRVRSKDMALTGLILNVLSIVIITIVVHVVRAL
jgi:sodium-dependent dicarboxylate transporter 2/3/5